MTPASSDRATGRASGPLVEYRGATVVRDGATILDDVSLTLARGEDVAVLGPNGSGKSTLVGLITGEARALARDDGPAVRVLGMERWDLFALRERIGVVSEALQDTYQRPVTLEDAVASGFFGSVGVPRHQHPDARMRARVREVLEFLGVSHLAGRRMDTLSTGEARRALIGRALVHRPEALVLDEPYNGLDPHARRDVRDMLRRLGKQGTSIVLVTHDIADIVPEVTRIVSMRDGRVCGDGPPHDELTAAALSALFSMPVEVVERDGFRSIV